MKFVTSHKRKWERAGAAYRFLIMTIQQGRIAEVKNLDEVAECLNPINLWLDIPEERHAREEEYRQEELDTLKKLAVLREKTMAIQHMILKREEEEKALMERVALLRKKLDALEKKMQNDEEKTESFELGFFEGHKC